MKISLLGHATFLIECAGQELLPDPYFGSWGNPALTRIQPPAARREDAPKPGQVLVSHNHCDHIDGLFLCSLNKDVLVLTRYLYQNVNRLPGARHTIGLIAW